MHAGTVPAGTGREKHSTSGGVHWSPLRVLTVGCQPTSAYDAATDTLFFMFKNNSNSAAYLTTTKGDDPDGWTPSKLVIDPATQVTSRLPAIV
eukprot:SAG22_NODE_350_length_11853_cov_3.693211_5_plen_93_part_00